MNEKTTKTAKKNRTQKRVAQTRQRLQDAALSIFSEKGVDAATVEEITSKADLGKGTLYQYFRDKYDIVVTLVEEAMGHLLERISCSDHNPQNLEEVLEHLLNTHYVFYNHNTEEFILLFQGRVLLKLQREASEDLEEPYVHYLTEIEKQIAPFLGQKIDPVRIRRLACAVAGFVFGFLSFAMIGMTDEEIETSIKPFRQVFVRSLSSFLTAGFVNEGIIPKGKQL